jgi:GDP-L-fucose synthase
MYAPDLADFIWTHLHALDRLPDLMNVGVGADYTVNEYYALAADGVGFDGVFVHDVSKPAGMMRKLLDVSQQTALGWAPKTPLKAGLAATYDYFRTL